MDFKINDRVRMKMKQPDDAYLSYRGREGIVVDFYEDDDEMIKVKFSNKDIRGVYYWRFELVQSPIDYSNFILSGGNNEIQTK